LHPIRWAELHNHNEIGYGKGTLERSYRIARNSLDIYAFTAHGYWPDPPGDDPKLVDYHARAFDRVSALFPHVVAQANAHYAPGEFVTLIGYEWHSIGWGDYVVLFPSDSGELYRGDDLDDLQRYAASQGAILVPHHVAYREGWRGTKWDALDPSLSPLVEVYSEHGNSLEREGLWPMLLHSMGGSTATQTVMAQVRRGRHMGFIAGTDNHYGHPATYGEGITGVAVEALTRKAVWEALLRRHTFAATGDRMEMWVESNGAIMGDALPVSARRVLDVAVNPLAPLEFVQIIKNGDVAQMWPGSQPAAAPDKGPYLVRVEWGWGRMGGPELTTWEIDLTVGEGHVEKVVPCFAGGAGSIELVNLVRQDSDQHLEIASFTSRANPWPISGVVLLVTGGRDTRLVCDVQSHTDDERGGCVVATSLGELLRDDAWGKVLPRFSSPRIRMGRAYAQHDLAFRAAWEDLAPGERDLYIVKAQQRNGQLAWTSPMLFATSEKEA